MGETSEHEFRRAMRSLCSVVSIISAGYKGKQFGMTATAVTSVSMTPPSLLVCINKSARIHDPLLGCRRFCVNVLHAQHRDLTSTFSNKAIDNRFASGQWAIDA